MIRPQPGSVGCPRRAPRQPSRDLAENRRLVCRSDGDGSRRGRRPESRPLDEEVSSRQGARSTPTRGRCPRVRRESAGCRPVQPLRWEAGLGESVIVGQPARSSQDLGETPWSRRSPLYDGAWRGRRQPWGRAGPRRRASEGFPTGCRSPPSRCSARRSPALICCCRPLPPSRWAEVGSERDRGTARGTIVSKISAKHPFRSVARMVTEPAVAGVPIAGRSPRE